MKRIKIEVVFRDRDQVKYQSYSLDSGVSIHECLVHLELDWQGAVGVWGKIMSRETILKEGDRLELYEDLILDPKELRVKGGLMKSKRHKAIV